MQRRIHLELLKLLMFFLFPRSPKNFSNIFSSGGGGGRIFLIYGFFLLEFRTRIGYKLIFHEIAWVYVLACFLMFWFPTFDTVLGNVSYMGIFGIRMRWNDKWYQSHSHYFSLSTESIMSDWFSVETSVEKTLIHFFMKNTLKPRVWNFDLFK